MLVCQCCKASFRLFIAKLEKDQVTWKKYQSAMEDYSSTQKVSKVEFLRNQDNILVQKVAEVVDVSFPLKFLGQSEHVAPFVSSSALTWSESKVITTSCLFTVYLVNLTSLGSSAQRAMRECVRLVADACAHCPERTVAFFIGPNVGGHGATYDEQEMEKTQDDCEAALKTPEVEMKVRRCQLIFSLDSISSRARASVHPMWMAMSGQVAADETLVCKFASSQLWHRRAVHNISMKPLANYVLPLAGIPPMQPNNLCKAHLFKQHISGVDLMDKLKENLWSGMDVSASHGAVFVDLLPYDDSLIMSTVQGLAKSRPKQPQEMVVSCIWARGDQDTDKRRANAEWLQGATHRSIDRMVRSKLLVIDGFDFKEFHPEGVAPVNDTKLYSLTFPTAEGNLAMRQTALDEWSVKFARLKKDYDETVEFNPSGFPYKADGQKRQAPSTEGEEAEGAPFPEDCMVESLEALKKAEGSLSTVRSLLSTVHLVFTSKGAMYLHAQETGVVSAKRPLCQVFGEYHSGQAEIAKAEKRKCSLFEWKMESPEDEAVFAHPTAWDPSFKQGVASFKEFVAFLADHNVVTFTMVCHDLDLEPGNLAVKNNEACCFEPKKLPAKAHADAGNCGSLPAWSAIDWQKGESKNGMLKLYMKLTYEDTNQGKGIFPAKPVWILAEARRVEKGKCYLVVPAPGNPKD